MIKLFMDVLMVFCSSFVVPGCIAMCDSVALKTLFEAQGKPAVCFFAAPESVLPTWRKSCTSPKSCSHARLSANFW